VFGPPRSGTSAISHVLESLGCYFGEREDFLDPTVHRHNPVFFELERVNRVNDAICRAMGGEYAEFSLIPKRADYTAALHEAFRDDIIAILEGPLGAAPLVGLKDPRFVYTLPVWRDALERLGYDCVCVVTSRAVAAAASSNALVNGFSDAHNRRIVELSTLLSAWQASVLPAVAVDFDAALAAPGACARTLAEHVAPDSIDEPRVDAAAAVLDPRHRNHGGDATTPPVPDVPLAANAEAYDILLRQLDSLGLDHLLTELRQARGDLLVQLLAASTTQAALVEARRVEAESHAALVAGHMAVVAGIGDAGRQPFPRPRFYALGPRGDFSEDVSWACETEALEGALVARAVVPAASLSSEVRFDPDEVPGTYQLFDVRVAGRTVGDLRDALVGYGGLPLHGDPLVLQCTGIDPWWRLALPTVDVDSDQVRLEFHFKPLNLAEVAFSSRSIQAALASRERRLMDVVAASADALRQEIEQRAHAADQVAASHALALESLASASAANEDRIGHVLAALDRLPALLAEFEQRAREGIEQRAHAANQVAASHAQALESLASASAANANRTGHVLAALERLPALLAEFEQRAEAARAGAAQSLDQRVDELSGLVRQLTAQARQDEASLSEIARKLELGFERILAEAAEARPKLERLELAAKRRSLSYWWRRLRGQDA
jgi:hypothetical protein